MRKNIENKVTIFDNVPGYFASPSRTPHPAFRQFDKTERIKRFVRTLREKDYDIGKNGSISKGKFQTNSSDGMKLLRDAVGRKNCELKSTPGSLQGFKRVLDKDRIGIPRYNSFVSRHSQSSGVRWKPCQ